jgi:hypothetical protein
MLKTEAIDLLGGTISQAAAAVGVTYQAVDKWPEVLPQRISDRVQAALWRMANGVTHAADSASSQASEARVE